MRKWNYYNGAAYTDFTTGKSVYEPMTAAYCADCAPEHLPGWNASAPRGREHWQSEFKCAPWLIGRPCFHCGKDI
jgi:hypothetical protein